MTGTRRTLGLSELYRGQASDYFFLGTKPIMQTKIIVTCTILGEIAAALIAFLFHQQMGNDSWLIITAMFGTPVVIGMAAQKVSVNRRAGQADND